MTMASTSAMRLAVAADTSAPPRPASRSSAASSSICALQLLGLGLQVVGAHQLGHHQAQAHAALGLRLEHLGRDRRLVGVLDAALLQVGARLLDHALDLGLHAGLRQVQLGLDQRVHHACLLRASSAELDFALEVLADVGAQAFDRRRRRCPATWRSASLTSGRCGASIFFSVTMKSACLPATSLPW